MGNHAFKKSDYKTVCRPTCAVLLQVSQIVV